MFLIEGIAISCVGDKATCPTHKVTATIVSGDPHMNILGKLAARAGDSLSCGCKLLPKQSLVVQDNGVVRPLTLYLLRIFNLVI